MQASDAPPQATATELAHALSGLWSEILRGSSRPMLQVFEELDLGLSHVKALHALDACGCELSVKELGERLGLSLPGASRTADALLKRGLLERREDADDRRIRRVGITPAGRDAVARIESARLANLESWAQRLSPEQRARLLDALPPASEGATP